MNDLREVSPVQQYDLQQGIGLLQARRNKMHVLTILSVVIVVVSAVALFFNQALVYSYFDLGLTVKQLHIPIAAQELNAAIGHHTSYFSNLIEWVMWLVIKLVAAFIGATLFVIFAKKINFFKRRMHNFGKRFLAWIIAFLLIITGVSVVQSEISDKYDAEQESRELVEYQSNIQESQIYYLVKEHQLPVPVENYLLAQAALLNQPVDEDAALAYVTQLIQAEKEDPNFLSYGFKPEQIWVMQNQVHAQALTSFAKRIESKKIMADQIIRYTQWVWMAMFAIFLFFAFILFGLTRQFDKRIARIENRLN